MQARFETLQGPCRRAALGPLRGARGGHGFADRDRAAGKMHRESRTHFRRAQWAAHAPRVGRTAAVDEAAQQAQRRGATARLAARAGVVGEAEVAGVGQRLAAEIGECTTGRVIDPVHRASRHQRDGRRQRRLAVVAFPVPRPAIAAAQTAHRAAVLMFDEGNAGLAQPRTHAAVAGEGPGVAGFLVGMDFDEAEGAMQCVEGFDGIAAKHEQRRAARGKGGTQFVEGLTHHRPLPRAGVLPPKVWLDDVHRQHRPPAGRGSEQGRVIDGAQVALEPDEGMGHGAMLPKPRCSPGETAARWRARLVWRPLIPARPVAARP